MTLDWPQESDVLEYLHAARFGWGTDGWRTMAEIAGHFECPEFARLLEPLERLQGSGSVEVRPIEHGPRLWRATDEGGPRCRINHRR